MEYEVQYAKIATTEKLADRFLNCQEKSSLDLGKSYMGKVYTLIEILSPWFPTAQVGQTIINTFFQSYYRGGSTSDLANFEEALKKVNETLAQITQNGETSWIGNLNGILAVVVENKLHLAQTGKAEAYIFRDGKTNHITLGLAQNQIDPHPLKTFSNVISGEIKPRDKVLIANPELFSYLDIDSIRQVITLNSPNEAILQIAKILKKKKVKTINAILLDLADSEEMARRTMTETSNVVQLDRPLESVWTQTGKFYRQIIKPVLMFAHRGTKSASEKSLTFTKSYLANLKNRQANEPIKKRDIFEKEFIDQKEKDDGLLKDEEIKYSPELSVHYYEQAQHEKARQNNKFLQFMNFVWGNLQKLWKFSKKVLSDPKKRPYALIVVAIIILLILGIFISGRRNNSTGNVSLLEAQNVLKDAESKEKEAKSALASGDKEKARQFYADAISGVKKIADNQIVKQSALEVLDRSYAELDKLNATTRFKELKPLVSNASNIKSVFMDSGRAYFIDDNQIYKVTLNGGQPEKIASLPRNNGDFQFGFMENKDIYLYTSNQKIYDFNINSEKIELIEGPWETANSAYYYAGNLYLLDGIIGQIYKHPSNNNGFEKGENYITSAAIDIKNSQSLAIDGSLYVLKNNGEVLKLQKGRLQDFSLKDLPAPFSKIENPIKIWTNQDTPSLYILDKSQKRIIEFDKEGHFIHQYALPEFFNEIKDFAVSIKTKKIWILNGGDLYEINI